MTDSHEMNQCHLILEPVGRRIDMTPDTTILAAVRQAGIEISAVCAGNGSCGMCKVIPISGDYSGLSEIEKNQLQPTEIKAGFRLACQTRVLSDGIVQIPPESLATLQRLQLESTQSPVPVKATYQRELLTLPMGAPGDGKSALDWVNQTLFNRGYGGKVVPHKLIPRLLKIFDDHQCRAALVFNSSRLTAIIPPEATAIGYAVDVGTTKIAGYVVDLLSGDTLASGGAPNPQISYGEDVISRIKFTDENPQGAAILQAVVINAINQLLDYLCRQAGICREQVLDCVMVGNTAMQHLIMGLPVHSLGTAPYVPAAIHASRIPAKTLGISLAEGANIYFPPIIAGFVGSDHTAMLLSTRARESGKTILALDIGTNTEISLINKENHLTCSCASGPAFEGAQIANGMRAVSGAIERIYMDRDGIKIQTIGNESAIGICGSGILDAVAEMRKENLIDSRGSFQKSDSRFSHEQGNTRLVLVSANQTGHGREIAVTRKDINRIQLAKAAIRSGVEVLLNQMGMNKDDIDVFIVAGAFGTYLDVKNSIRIGMFPDLPLERFLQTGNSAGQGAREILVSAARRKEAERMVKRIQYIELTSEKGYQDLFIDALRIAEN
jgi:uncharacterized 2Fe-2S/4Fe-4S cluster protein (DUF4445 family)